MISSEASSRQGGLARLLCADRLQITYALRRHETSASIPAPSSSSDEGSGSHCVATIGVWRSVKRFTWFGLKAARPPGPSIANVRGQHADGRDATARPFNAVSLMGKHGEQPRGRRRIGMASVEVKAVRCAPWRERRAQPIAQFEHAAGPHLASVVDEGLREAVLGRAAGSVRRELHLQRPQRAIEKDGVRNRVRGSPQRRCRCSPRAWHRSVRWRPSRSRAMQSS